MKRARLLFRELLDHRMAAAASTRISPVSENRGRTYRFSDGNLSECGCQIQLRDSGCGRSDARSHAAAAKCGPQRRSAVSRSRIFSSAERTLASSSFSSGVVNRSAFTSVCLRS